MCARDENAIGPLPDEARGEEDQAEEDEDGHFGGIG